MKEDISWIDRVKVALQVAHSISYLHQHRIIHRDIKTENVLIVQGSGTAKLCDFGFSRSNNDDAAKQKTFCGSEWFEAPEIMFCMDYDERIDIFSYGVVLCELIARKAPSMSIFRREVPGFGISSEEIKTRANEGCPPALTELVINTVESDPDHRPSFAEIIARLGEIYEKIAGKPYTDFQEELRQAEEKLQLFNLQQEERAAQEPEFVPEPEPEPQEEEIEQPKQPKQPEPEVTQPAPSSAAPPAPAVTNNSPPSTTTTTTTATEDKTVSYTSSTLLTVARMQAQAELAGSESRGGSSSSLLKSVIPQKDQLAWRAFLVEFRSSVKVRDVQKSAAMRIKTFRNCFPGSEAVDWLAKEKKMDRVEGLELCRILVKLSVVRGATPTGTTGGDKVYVSLPLQISDFLWIKFFIFFFFFFFLGSSRIPRASSIASLMMGSSSGVRRHRFTSRSELDNAKII